MDRKTVQVGSIEIEVSETHIYLSDDLPDSYDFVPWNIINKIIECGSVGDAILLDIGANVGDSVAHFRRFSNRPAIGVEASEYFFEILKRNSPRLGDLEIVQSMLLPKGLEGKVKFSSGGQTGTTSIAPGSDDGSTWNGPTTSFDELLCDEEKRYIVKSDTDGFDAVLMADLLRFIKEEKREVPVVFFEGPSAEQTMNGEFEDWFELFDDFVKSGYGLLLLTNIGFPYCYTEDDAEVAKSALRSLSSGYRRNRALCHYFDVIAFDRRIECDEAKLKKIWGDEVFSRA